MVSRSKPTARRDREPSSRGHDEVRALPAREGAGAPRRVVRGLRHDIRERPRVAAGEIRGADVDAEGDGEAEAEGVLAMHGTSTESRLDVLLTRRERALRALRLSEERLAARQAEAARIDARLRAHLLRTGEPALTALEPPAGRPDSPVLATAAAAVRPLLSPPRPPTPGEHLTRRDPEGARIHARLDRALRRLDLCEQSFVPSDLRRVDAARDVAELRGQLDRLRPRLLWNALERERQRDGGAGPPRPARAAEPFGFAVPVTPDATATLDRLMDECTGLRHAIEELRRDALGVATPETRFIEGATD